MKAFVLEGIGNLKYKSICIPKLKKGEALVKVKVAGICGSDIPRIFKTGTYNFPTIPGHEFSGIVSAVHEDDDKAWVGKRVSVFPLIPCKKCSECKKENYEMCENYNYTGSRTDGGFAEYVKVPIWNLIDIGNKISFENAAMLEPTCVALHALRKVDIKKHNTIAVYGTGTIGILIIQWLKAYGVNDVVAIGTNDNQKNMIQNIMDVKFYNINDFVSQKEFLATMIDKNISLLYECVGNNDTINNSIYMIQPGGELVFIGNPDGNILFEKEVYWKILRKQLRLYGVWNSSFINNRNDDWNTAIKFISEGRINPSLQITHKLEFEQLFEALDIMRNKDIFSNKVIINN
ncbi:galactitol-1-phosphate 5-dehydrogenase [Clostridium butyricum]|uniref:galactitol-1-phosphate 5-dehydrogenase n=1 Tax=Clostridium butyricum TaxID=1492 RepID=UPI001CA93A93|nr:galactitol-1-phosphate 5-dehydrogenase [Clostridium butyricum]MBZ0312906.1 galactitol-1-phosphate 5-dehydrogenase [Clostridium butyricum]